MLLREDIVINKVDENEYIIENKLNNSYIKMGKHETDFLLSFSKDYKDNKEINFSEEQKECLIKTFLNLKLIKDENNSDETKTTFFDSLKRLDISKIKLYSFNPDKLFERISKVTDLLITKTAAYIYVLIIMLAFIVSINNRLVFLQVTSNILNDFNILNLIILYSLMFATVGIHEFSHGITCKKYANKVTELGFMLFYLQPAMYCNVSSVYLLKDKKQKVIVFLSGVISQIILSSIAILTYFLMSRFGYKPNILIYYSLSNVLLALYNLIPLIKLDGYWVLSTLLDVKNLREKSINLVLALILGQDIKEKHESKRNVFLIYGLSAIVFTGIIWLLLFIKVNTYANSFQNEAFKFMPGCIMAIICLHLIKTLYEKKKKFSLGGI